MYFGEIISPELTVLNKAEELKVPTSLCFPYPPTFIVKNCSMPELKKKNRLERSSGAGCVDGTQMKCRPTSGNLMSKSNLNTP